jgi:tRNA threonylcarbamoyladenosine biosynthesis protein TsaB
MRLIALETATEACSAALWLDGELRWRLERAAARRHGELILQQIDSLLADAGLQPADLDAVAVGRGPGAFTGVRLGLGVAQGLAFALGCSVVPVSTLAALAQQGADRGADQILALLDARMGEVYWSLCAVDAGGLVIPGPERLSAPAEIHPAWTGSRPMALGSGVAVRAGFLPGLGLAPDALDAAALPCAREVAILGAAALARGEQVSPERAQPVYLRDRIAEPAPMGGASPPGAAG